MMYLTPLFLSNLGFQVAGKTVQDSSLCRLYNLSSQAALSVISPNQGDRLDFSQANTVKWSSEQ
jgi:hypothetical protein